MRHFLLVALFALFTMPAVASDDDYELADLLVKRGWFDLAEDLFRKIQKDSSLPREKRSEAEYGLARVNLVKAERERVPAKTVEKCDAAIEAIQKFVDGNRNHPRRAEALADIGDLRQIKGKALVLLSKSDPDALDRAETEFDKAEALFEEQIRALEKRKISPPDAEDRAKNPSKYKRELQAWEDHEQAMMFAKYNKGIAIFNRAETYRENPDKRAEMRKKLETMIALFGEFMWDYSTYFLAYDAAIFMGRASMMLAGYSDRAKAERHWANCFRYIGTAKSPLRDPENRRSEMVRNLGTRGYYHEIKARMAYGETKKSRAATREFLEAARLAEELFRLIPSARKTNIGKLVQLEQAKAYCKAGKVPEGIALLDRIIRDNKATQWIVNRATDIIGEYAGETDLERVIESADNLYEREELYRALPKYHTVLNATKSGEEKERYYAHCWNQIGLCYYWLARYREASIALGQIVYEGSPWLEGEHLEITEKAALKKLQAHKALVYHTGNSDDRANLDRYRAFVTRVLPDVVGEGELAGRAIDLENGRKYLESNALWQKLARQGNPYHEVALFSIGQNYYKYALSQTGRNPSEATKYFQMALRQFKDHLAFVEKLTKKQKGVIRNAIGSILFSCRIHADERYPDGNPLEALAISADLSSKFPKADPKLLIAIMSARLNAKLRLSKLGFWYCPQCRTAVKPDASGACPPCKKTDLHSYLQEAEKDMRTLQESYLEIGLGREDYLRALALLAEAFEESAFKLAGSDPRLAKELTLKSIGYYVDYIDEVPDALQGKKMLFMAEKLFAAAEGLRDRGTDDSRKKAETYFEKAGDLLKTYVANEGGLEDMDPAQGRHIRRMITRANVMSGNYDEAIADLKELTRSDTQMKDGSTWEDLADCYKAKAKAMQPSGDRLKLYKEADRIYAKLAGALMAGNRVDGHFYRLLYGHALCLSQIDPDQLSYLYRSMDSRGFGRRFACDKCHEKFAEKDLKRGKACPKCENEDLFIIAWDDRLRFTCDESKGGCGKKSPAREAKDFQRMTCTTCSRAYPMSEPGPFCSDENCPGKKRGRLKETIQCPSCKKEGTTIQTPVWTREEWLKGPYHARFEDLREELENRLPRK